MPNRNYLKGRAKEYRITNQLRSEGWDIVQRTAGSHSNIDVFAINKKLKRIIFIQSKPDDYSERKTIEIENEMNWLDGLFKVEFIVR